MQHLRYAYERTSGSENLPREIVSCCQPVVALKAIRDDMMIMNFSEVIRCTLQQ